MTLLKEFLLLIILPLVCSRPQINLDLTDWNRENNDVLQHDCIDVLARRFSEIDPQQIISYCLGELPSKWKIEENTVDQKLTFLQLKELGVTNEQLYHWSAPMDTIENYQFYLNGFASISTDWFYNCSSSTFGPLCQYSFDGYESSSLSLRDIILDYYSHAYRPTTMTCYTHVNCTFNGRSICLDWRNICDGQADCPINGIDEKYCSELSIDQCDEDDQYKCTNGHCIPKTFLIENDYAIDCYDRQDIALKRLYLTGRIGREPTSVAEDTLCLKYYWSRNPFQSLCVLDRTSDLLNTMFPQQLNSTFNECRYAFQCHFSVPNSIHPENCANFCPNESCQSIIARSCPEILYIPTTPILFGHIRFAYTKQDALQSIIRQLPPSYICYDHRLCGGFLPNASLRIFENSTCRKPRDFPVKFAGGGRGDWFITYVLPILTQLYQCNTKPDDFLLICNRSTMYQCRYSSKCISNNRVGDNYQDCDYHDDEEEDVINQVCTDDRSEQFFNCSTKCINRIKLENGVCDCPRDEYGICIDESLYVLSITTHLSFPNICDGFTELIPVKINGTYETDETECQFWHCNNTYTRCDGFWNCPDGADEVGCHPSSLLSCPEQHICISPDMTELMCLPLGKFNDGIKDCLGSMDESAKCEPKKLNFYCKGDPSEYCTRSRYLCNEISRCRDNDYDSWFCLPEQNLTITPARCYMSEEEFESKIEQYLCQYPSKEVKELKTRHFALEAVHQSDDLIDSKEVIPPLINGFQQRCHRGLPIRVWLNKEKNLTDITCLCPPSFYGNTCQYQNERVRLTLKLLAYSASRRTLFNILVMLIDDTPQRTIHYYQQFSYLYVRDCSIKFNVYLLYSTRPKDLTKNYSVRIDVHEKDSLIHRGSFLIPLKFLFLPIQRPSYHLHIPPIGQNEKRCSNLPCVHGQCLSYSYHSKNLTFCHCKPGWSGQYCHIAQTCNCSSDSFCVGQSVTNQSICICPRNKFGSRCLLDNPICQSNDLDKPCFNGGECVPVDEHMAVQKKFFCICPKSFQGDRCQIRNTQILLSFHPNITLPLSMIIHFIQIVQNNPPNNGSTFATISTKNRSSIIYWPHGFHISFLELFTNDYYLVLVQKKSNTSTMISRTINPSDRCPNLKEILGENVTQLHPLRRMKYYHIPCQNLQQNLSCFYDQTHFCLCTNFDGQRLANCLEFHSGKKFDCFGQGNCVNGGECLQDRLTCPSISVCMCPKCFYGKQCQFSTDGFGLSLDGILGYHIQPHVKITRQPIIIQISVGLAIIMTITGFIDSILSIITFSSIDLQKIGCGVYLLASSITTLLLTVLFAVKFLVLIIAQMAYLSNRTFLNIQCLSLDYLLRVCLNIDQWLNACVAIERAVTSTKGTYFDQKKSKQMAKYVLIVLIFFIFLSNSYDPLHRDLLDDDGDGNNHEQKRIWCFVSYSSRFLSIYHSLINILHFFIPFLINIISGIVIIFVTTRQRRYLHRDEMFRSTLIKQIKQHKQILIAPMVLTLLALPRLIISFVSGCMKSTDDAWLFLIGYLISYLPSMLTFVVFVLPSKLYRKEFSSKVRRYRSNLQTRLGMS